MIENFTLGYDTEGRKIVIDVAGNYVTHIPNNLSEQEVLARLQRGETIRFDARNQGMQNIPTAQIDENIPVLVAPKERWPLFYAWRMNWLANWDDHDMRTFEEFELDYKSVGLSPEQEMQIISDWENYLKINPHARITFEEFRNASIKQVYQIQSIVEQTQDTPLTR